MRMILNILMATAMALPLAGLPALAGEPGKQQIALHIEARPLKEALNAFAQQSGLQIVFYSNVSEGLKSAVLSGKYSAQAALDQLLANTPLAYEFINPRTVAIRLAKENTSSHSSVAEQMRVAENADSRSLKAGESDAGKATEQITVRDNRIKPFNDRNVDLPRTINDPQAYYIFDSKVIERSGAVSVEDFLQHRLTMNSNPQMSRQSIEGGTGNFSNVNLRGLGTANTLLLVNGRRLPNVAFGSTSSERAPDINGIPISAIERIEVLPTSSSGIYGAGALGGVVNIILKNNYAGGELRATYRNTVDTDAPIRTVSASYGLSLEGGKTNVMVNGQYADEGQMLLRDRIDLVRSGYLQARRNNPSRYGTSAFTPVVGALPNIRSDDGSDLTLKETGVSLGSPIATLPTGYSSASSPGTIIPGQWNLELPEGNQIPNGLLLPLGALPETHAFGAIIRRQMKDNIEWFVEFGQSHNGSDLISNPFGDGFALFLESDSPVNPFNQAVQVSAAFNANFPTRLKLKSSTLATGLTVSLPNHWIGQADYSWGTARSDHVIAAGHDFIGLNGDLALGAVNPFVDTRSYPLSMDRYIRPSISQHEGTTNSIALRASGPLIELPWGQARLTALYEHRKSGSDGGASESIWPITSRLSASTTFFGQSQSVDGVYGELSMPLIANSSSRTLLSSLELQLAARRDHYSVKQGTISVSSFINRNPPALFWSPETPPNGQPMRFVTEYSSTNKTLALRYSPMKDWIVRASYSTAYLPPTYEQLVPNLIPGTSLSLITDPVTDEAYGVPTLSGGNPGLTPQRSESFNAGVVWEPSEGTFEGARASIEFYRIDQFDVIGSLSPQDMVDDNFYAGRVMRDGATGRVTLVDISLVNITRRTTRGWDVSLGYRWNTPYGNLFFDSIASLVRSEQRQNSIEAALLDYAGFVSDGGPIKGRGNVSITWEHAGWTAGWNGRYYSTYRHRLPSLIATQGSERVPSQHYHDLFLSYAFGESVAGGGALRRAASAASNGVTVTLGIGNVFDSSPPFDASNRSLFYSPFGGNRSREYWVNLLKRI